MNSLGVNSFYILQLKCVFCKILVFFEARAGNVGICAWIRVNFWGFACETWEFACGFVRIFGSSRMKHGNCIWI